MPRPMGYQVGAKQCLNLPQDSQKTIVSGHFFKNPLKKRISHFSGLLLIFVYPSADLNWQKLCTIEQNGFIKIGLNPPCAQTTDHQTNTVTLTITDHYRLLLLPLPTITNTGRKLQITSGICSVVLNVYVCFFRSVHLLVHCPMVGQVLLARLLRRTSS